MPQLDKVTLFSQVFWLLFLYFFFFLVFLKYFLPSFSKVFKVRSYYLFNEDNNSKTLMSKKVSKLFCFTPLLSKFEVQIKNNLTTLQDYCFSELNYYNSTFFKDLNKLFVLGFLKNCLKFSFFKKLYF